MTEKKKVTIYDIAKALDISSGTVFRALHDTGRINEDTKKRVLEKAGEMGYTTNLAAQGLRRNPIYIGVLLCCPVEPFLLEVKRGVDSMFDELRQYKVYPDMHVLNDNVDGHEKEIDKLLASFKDSGCKGVILFLSGDAGRYKEKVDDLVDSGIIVANVVTDIPDSRRSVFVSNDYLVSGKLAAEMLHIACGRKNIAVLTVSKEKAESDENIAGFMQYASKNSFRSIDIYETHNISANVLRQMKTIFSDKKKYSGLYITSASSIYLYKYRDKLELPENIKIVTTDLLEETRALLDEEITCATIFQDPYMQGRRATELLYKCINEKNEEMTFKVTPQIVLRSNRHLYS